MGQNQSCPPWLTHLILVLESLGQKHCQELQVRQLQGKTLCFKKQTEVITRAVKMAQRVLTINLANLSPVGYWNSRGERE